MKLTRLLLPLAAASLAACAHLGQDHHDAHDAGAAADDARPEVRYYLVADT